MPIYEYICATCNADHEAIQKISDAPLTKCPECEDEALVKKTSMSAFHLKGGGWYKDGYGEAKNKSKDQEAKTTNTKEAGSKETTSKSNSSDSKPVSSSSKSSKAKAS